MACWLAIGALRNACTLPVAHEAQQTTSPRAIAAAAMHLQMFCTKALALARASQQLSYQQLFWHGR